jgi:hypothetical protein
MHPQTLAEALHTAQEFDVVPLALYTLVGVARLMAYKGDKERAAELLGLVTSHPVSSDFAKNKAWEVVSELEAELPPEVFAEAQQRGASYDLNLLINEILLDIG